MRRLALSALLSTSAAFAGTVSVEIPKPGPVSEPHTSPAGHSGKHGDIAWDSASLLRNGKPWIPVMGEFHYSRYPNAEWRDELLKMKAGGVTLISTYVFWIHHEEEQGKFTWDGDKNLRQFVQTCADLDLPLIVRVGPWCHGEVRNGGFPDWVQAMPRKRTNDPQYLAAVKTYYDQIGQQLKGLYWKDDGPIVGIQFENEFKGPAAHLVTLKEYGLAAGMDVPIYTRTAWDNATNVPTFGEVLPLWGGYAEGFWDRTLNTMPGAYWQVFQFMRDGVPNNMMGSDPTAAPAAGGRPNQLVGYPYLTCELGGGMMSSYHRRIDISPMDVYATALCKIGSGSNMPGYYMYHGGTNPDGKLSYLMEAQGPPQNMWNDMPVKNYDFDAILGACGEVRESYHLTRQLHMFLADWGQQLARMPATYAGVAKGKQDADTLRWAVRSDGKSGFLFVNNYQRAMDMPVKNDVRFEVKMADGVVSIPAAGGVAIPANRAFILPFNMDLGLGKLLYATAQPVCTLTRGTGTTIYFEAVPGMTPEFRFTSDIAFVNEPTAPTTVDRGTAGLITVKNPRNTVVLFNTQDARNPRTVSIQMLDPKDGEIWKGTIAGKECLVRTNAEVEFDGNGLRLSGTQAVDVAFEPRFDVAPAAQITALPDQGPTHGLSSALAFRVNLAPSKAIDATAESLKAAGPLRTIAMGSQRVAAEPTDADFDNAAAWSIKIPDGAAKSLLRLHYTGDVARIYIGDKFVLDDFYHGQPLDIALWRYSKEDLAKGITVKILPLQKGAPIYMAKWPEFDGDSVARIDSTELVEQRTVTIEAK